MGNATVDTNDFSGGIYRGRSAPGNAVYDAINALIDDEGQLFKRGGSAFVTTSDAGETLLGLRSVFFPGPNAVRTFALGASSLHVVSGVSFATLPYALGAGPAGVVRVASAGLVAAWPIGVSPVPAIYAGSAKTAYNTGTATVTKGSATVTGSGTSWTANADAGMFLVAATAANRSPEIQVVKSVDSNTQLTLATPWAGPTAAGTAYVLYPVYVAGQYGDNASHDPEYANIFAPFPSGLGSHAAFVGRRLLLAYGTRIAMTPVDNPGTQHASEYHELPGDALIVGLDGIESTAVVFTTTGVGRLTTWSSPQSMQPATSSRTSGSLAT